MKRFILIGNISLVTLLCTLYGWNSYYSKIVLVSNQLVFEGENNNNIIAENNDKKNATILSDYNMVNYNISDKSITYEYFDVNNYNKRGQIFTDLSEINNSNLTIKRTVINENLIEYTEPYIPNNNSIEVLGTGGINGNDDREEITNTNVFPYSPTGQLVAVYSFKHNNKIVTIVEYGTGFLEGPNVLATAAHCVYKDVTVDEYDDDIFNPRFPDSLTFYPAKNGNVVPYTSNAIKVNINKEYYNNADVNNDWAVIELENSIGNYVGWYGKISNWYIKDKEAISYGYPYEKNGKMWLSSGIIEGTTEYYYKTNLDITFGQSGSGISIEYNNGDYICGIVSHYSENIFGITKYTGATKINNFIFHYLNSYVESNIQWPVC